MDPRQRNDDVRRNGYFGKKDIRKSRDREQTIDLS